LSGTGASRTIVVDANILINLLHVGRVGLLAVLPGYDCVVPEDVVAEITDPIQRQQLEAAIASGSLRVETITEPDDLVEYAELRRTLGRGEAACLVLARRHAWIVASDEKGRFRREATTRLGAGQIVNTAGLFVAAIRAGIISIEDADKAKFILEQHRFTLPFASFREILERS
jgi:predicted nucleic acid-binding protein